MLKYFCLAIIQFSYLVHLQAAESLDARAKQAEAFYLAKDFDKALSLYDSLRKEPLNLPQAAVVNFNRARTLLEMERWADASASFEEIAADSATHPALAQKAYQNIAIAKFRAAQNMSQGLKQSSGKPQEIILKANNALNQIQEGFLAITKAKKSEDDLAVIEGKTATGYSKDLIEVYRNLKALQAWLLHEIEDIKIRTAPDLDNIKTILQKVDKSQARIDLIASQKIPDKQSALYMKEESLQLRTIQPYFDEQRRRLKESSDDLQKPSAQLFLDAERDILTAEELLKENRQGRGRLQLASASYKLSTLKNMEEGSDPLSPLLNEAVALRKKINKTAENDPLRPLYIEQDRLLHDFAAQTVPSLTDDKVLERALFDELKNSLQIASKEKNRNVDAAKMRLAFYNQIVTPEGDTLLDLYLFAQKAPSQNKEGLDHFFQKIEPLQRKLTVRNAHTTESHEKKKIESTLEQLGAILAKKQNVLDSSDAWEKIAANLEEALAVWDPVKLAQGRLLNLRELYEKTLAKAQISQDDIEQIAGGHHALQEYLEKDSIKNTSTEELTELKNNLARAMAKVNQSKAALQNGLPLTSTLYLTAAAQWANRSLPLLEAKQSLSPQQILENSLSEQQNAYEANRLLHLIDKAEKVTKELFDVLSTEQSVVIDTVSPLPKVIAAEEQKKHPWDEAIPLIEKGKNAANDAGGYLNLSTPELSKAIERQSAAIRFWKEALEKLKDPNQNQQEGPGASDAQDGQQSESSSLNESTNLDQNQESKQDKLAPSKVFELLQTMERDDERDREKKNIPPKQGLRPW